MPKEIDILKKLANGIKNKNNSSNKIDTEKQTDEESADNKYQPIPLRSIDEIIKDNKTTDDMEKRDQ